MSRIEFTYTVNGQRYTNDTVSYKGFVGTTLEPARRLKTRFPLQARVPVYYDPANPRRAVLDPGVESGDWAMIGGLILAAVVFMGTKTF
jgi:hypothetical protein